MARVRVVVDPLGDDAGAVALVEPVRVDEELVRPDLQPGMTPPARLVGDRGQERRPEPAAACGGEDVEPLERAVRR